MRLSDVLSKSPEDSFQQLEGFLEENELKNGEVKEIDVGKVVLPFFCTICKNKFNFFSQDQLSCIGIDDYSVSIYCVLNCQECNILSIPAWFLVTCDYKNKIFESVPYVKILKRNFNFFISEYRFEGFEEKLTSADLSHATKLGSGSINYLRQMYEKIADKVYEEKKKEFKNKKEPKKFKDKLTMIANETNVIPHELSKNRYKLYKEMSKFTHGKPSEELALQQYNLFKCLVVAIIENATITEKIKRTLKELKWIR